ncbi:MAG: hypothetical protein A4S09_15695 [Proteobacteria bacterium SG_bin7]|nr:MAG: hypothetical protein A4S09_15695 [Proteobacteria bacterium SG_bin7]
MKRKRLSLKAKTMYMFLSMILLAVAVAGLMVFALNGVLKDLALGNMVTAAQALSRGTAAQFFERYGDVQAFAQHGAMQTKDESAIVKALNKYIELYVIYDIIALYNTDGELVAVNNTSSEGSNIPYLDKLKALNQKTSKWFVGSLRENYTDDKPHGLVGSYVEDFHLDPISSAAYGQPRYGTSFSHGVKNADGKVIAVLTARANFHWVEREFQSYYANLKAIDLEGVEMTMINSSGQVILEYDPSFNNSTQVQHRDDTLLRLNLVEDGFSAAVEARQGRTGSVISMNKKKQVQQFVGFTNMKDQTGFLGSLGWSVLVRAEENVVLGKGQRAVRPYYFIAAILIVLALLGAFWVSTVMSRQMVSVTERLQTGADEASQTAEKLQECSKELAVCSNEQAAAVQETVAAMEEMNSMIGQASTFIGESLSSTKRVSDKTEEGTQIMSQMVEAMASIQEANSQLQNMANIISEISAKTNVINDIVFKTQLLSFNASIEAARAGQHGRGFAVVAEEVGNLAQMSGAAAKEIKVLLDDSQKQVMHIVEITRTRSQDGQEVSKRAQKTFDDIAFEIRAVTQQIENVNIAAQEQESGVQQTTTSMKRLDDSTTRSARMGEQVSAAATTLSEQSRRMNQIMRATLILVQGSSAEIRRERNDGMFDDIINSGSQKSKGNKRNFTNSLVAKLKDAKNSGTSTAELDDDNMLNVVDKIKAKGSASNSEKVSTSDVDASADDESFKKTV